jgi:hypothetical protein
MMDYETELTADRLREVLRYSPSTGVFHWRVMSSSRRPAGSVAGELKPSGYILIGVDGFRYRAHRLAWLYMLGMWPDKQVDHKDNNRSNNIWKNLRLADNAQNQANSRCSKNNKAGFKGVYWHKRNAKWAAKINPGRKQVHLGCYDSPSEAHEAYLRGAQKYFGTFARAA